MKTHDLSLKSIIPVLVTAFIACPVLFSQLTASANEPKKPAPKTHKFELQHGGLIPHALILGYLPRRPAVDDLAKIEHAIGEAPFGGQSIVLKQAGPQNEDLDLRWKRADARKPEIPNYMYDKDGFTLFVGKDGRPVEDASAYLYCQLESPSNREFTLILTGGEPVTVRVNDELLPTDDRNRFLSANGARIPIKLNEGRNRLLIRMENRYRDEFLAPRLVDQDGKPATDVYVSFESIEDCPTTPDHYLQEDWNELTSRIPPLPASPDEATFGANLSRTMALLESGGQTRRPVRIAFYGQSITAQRWVWHLVRRLRARYPKTIIEPENYAIGGWGINRLNRTIKHHVLHTRPDLVVLHAYHGGSWNWERIIQKIRRETTADIMIRSAHISRHEQDEPISLESSESTLLRRLARKYGCEMVECRHEWINYARTHKMSHEDLRSDGVHLNENGCILMAQLYERHFRRFPIWRPWFQTVRRYDAMRSLADHQNDEVRLIGNGWNIDRAYAAVSRGSDDQLKLKFRGNRIDLIMPQCQGRAKILIDGKTPSEWNMFKGTRPSYSPKLPAGLMTYHMGDNMVEETWTLRFTHDSGDRKRFRYTLTGSQTGPDGEGGNDQIFTSNSGRITILPNDFLLHQKGADKTKTELESTINDWQIRWHVTPRFKDEVIGIKARKDEAWMPWYNHPYRYITIADGLPPGEHELTLLPVEPDNPNHWFAISGVDVHRPPLWDSSR